MDDKTGVQNRANTRQPATLKSVRGKNDLGELEKHFARIFGGGSPAYPASHIDKTGSSGQSRITKRSLSACDTNHDHDD